MSSSINKATPSAGTAVSRGASSQKIFAPDFTSAPPSTTNATKPKAYPSTSVSKSGKFQADASLPQGQKLFADSTGSELKASKNNTSTYNKSSTKKKPSNGNSNHNNTSTNTNGESNAAPAVRQAKEDLLRLGIELDDDLITRLQNNLGIDKIFEVAHQAATILAPQPSLDLAAQTQEVAFRHVSHGNAKVGFSLDTRQPVHASLQPFVSDLIAINPKHSIQILKQLDNRADEIEPQYRPHLDHMIQSFRLQYARAPCRFIGRLLGRKWNSATDKTQEESLITRWILKTRYVTKQDFATMITRVAPNAKVEVINTLFLLLREEKQFGNPQKHTIVDLWAFLTLLKTASEESRRSFDGSKSKLANEVEFWRETNASSMGTLCGQEEHKDANQTTSSSSTVSNNNHRRNGLPSQPPIEVGWRLFENIESANIRHIDAQETHYHQFAKKKLYHTKPNTSGETTTFTPTSVATLLGQPHHRHAGESSSGRAVMGRLHNEVVDSCDVPSALNSPTALQRRPVSSILPHDALQREDVLPIPPAQYVHDSRNVAYLLNNQEYLQQAMQTKRPSSSNILQREWASSSISVAVALGNTGQNAQTHSQKAAKASSLGAFVNNQQSKNNNSGQNKNALAPPPPPPPLPAGRGMRMSSVNALHWEHARPSVAAALGGGN